MQEKVSEVSEVSEESEESEESVKSDFLRVTLVSTIKYSNRVLGQVDIENSHGKYRTYFYRSTGTNVRGKGMWFPFSCISGPGAIERTSMHNGWISKNMVLSNKEFTIIIPTRIMNDYQHNDPEMRLNAFHNSKITFSIKEVSDLLYSQYEENQIIPIADIKEPLFPEDVGFINTWIIKGLLVIRQPKEDSKLFES